MLDCVAYLFVVREGGEKDGKQDAVSSLHGFSWVCCCCNLSFSLKFDNREMLRSRASHADLPIIMIRTTYQNTGLDRIQAQTQPTDFELCWTIVDKTMPQIPVECLSYILANVYQRI